MADKPTNYGIGSEAEASALRQRIVALQKSAANLAQLSLDELSTLLPAGTSSEQLIEIKKKLEQLHSLQNRGTERDMSLKDFSESHHAFADEILITRGSRYKTELCRPYEENGVCKYGARCQFAHGPSELRNLTRHPKYKSQLCRTFHSNGLCPYGHRCHFIHNQDEMRVGVPPTSANASVNSSFDSSNNRCITNSKANGVFYGKKSYSDFGSFSWNGVNFSQFQPNRLTPPVTLAQNPFIPPMASKPLPIFPSASLVSSASNAVSTSTSPTAAFSIGSAGELSPPMSPIVFSSEDAFSPQNSNCLGYFFPGALSAPALDKPLVIKTRSFGQSGLKADKLTESTSSLLSPADDSNINLSIANLSRQVPIWWKGN